MKRGNSVDPPSDHEQDPRGFWVEQYFDQMAADQLQHALSDQEITRVKVLREEIEHRLSSLVPLQHSVRKGGLLWEAYGMAKKISCHVAGEYDPLTDDRDPHELARERLMEWIAEKENRFRGLHAENDKKTAEKRINRELVRKHMKPGDSAETIRRRIWSKERHDISRPTVDRHRREIMGEK